MRCADACTCRHCAARLAAELAWWAALPPDDPRWVPAAEWAAVREWAERWHAVRPAATRPRPKRRLQV